MIHLFILLGALGPWEIVLIILALLLLFGGKKIPELMKGLGQGMKEFKKASSDAVSEKRKDDVDAGEQKELKKDVYDKQ